MPALYLTEADVRSLVTIQDAMEVVEQVFRHLASGQAENMKRQRLRTDQAMMHVLAGADRQQSQLGWKIYTTTRTGARFLVGLYDGESGQLEALIEADFLGQLRTGAASGVATRFLANPAAKSVAIIGSGLQARTQAWAVCAARPIEQVLIFSRDPERRAEFARSLATEVNCEVTAVDSAAAAVQASDIVVTATTSKTPVFEGSDLLPGAHINAVGSNFLSKTELDLETFRRVSLIACDSREQCRDEAGDFVKPLEQGLLEWTQVYELADVVAGRVTRAAVDQLTLFKSVGLGLEDVALGARILQRAREQKIGKQFP